MIKTIEFNGKEYPEFQASGNAARFIIPFAKEVCKGDGLDIGCNRYEWKFQDAFPVDPVLNQWEANLLPEPHDIGIFAKDWDYIFSSHCLEHLHDWTGVLNYWKTKLRSSGVLFLYLPHPSQEYWLTWNNRKHVNILHPQDIENYLKSNGFKNVFVSGCDLNNSFVAMGEKI